MANLGKRFTIAVGALAFAALLFAPIVRAETVEELKQRLIELDRSMNEQIKALERLIQQKEAEREKEMKVLEEQLQEERKAKVLAGYDKGFLSWMEYVRPQIEAERVGTDLAQLERRREAAQERRAQLTAERRAEEIELALAVQEIERERTDARGVLARLRHEVAAVDSPVLARFLPRWHGMEAPPRGHARLEEVIEQLDGHPVVPAHPV